MPGSANQIELLMPVETYWEVEDLIKKADYLIAAGDGQSMVSDYYREICQKIAPYAIYEKDRIWLYAKAGASG